MKQRAIIKITNFCFAFSLTGFSEHFGGSHAICILDTGYKTAKGNIPYSHYSCYITHWKSQVSWWASIRSYSVNKKQVLDPQNHKFQLFLAQAEHCKNAGILVGQQHSELQAFFPDEKYVKCKFLVSFSPDPGRDLWGDRNLKRLDFRCEIEILCLPWSPFDHCLPYLRPQLPYL